MAKIVTMIVLLVVALILGPTVQAALPAEALADSSGNGFQLTEDPDGFELDNAAFGKYGLGVTTGTFNNAVYTLTGFNLLGNVSLVVAFRIDDAPAGVSETLELANLGGNSVGGEANNLNFRLFLRETAGTLRIRYEHQSGVNVLVGNQLLSTLVVTPGEHTVTATRIVATNTVIVKVDGVEYINGAYLADTTGGQPFGRFVAVTGGQSQSSMYETRVWSVAVSQSTLDQIADPDDPAFAGTGEGSELALYFFEHDCVRAQAQGISTFFANIGPFALILVVMMAVVFAVILFVVGKVKV